MSIGMLYFRLKPVYYISHTMRTNSTIKSNNSEVIRLGDVESQYRNSLGEQGVHEECNKPCLHFFKVHFAKLYLIKEGGTLPN